jgi:hypothetical protein
VEALAHWGCCDVVKNAQLLIRHQLRDYQQDVSVKKIHIQVGYKSM